MFVFEQVGLLCKLNYHIFLSVFQSRLGAVKLRNGSVSIARSAPKGCKFGLIVHAPDPTNKRM